MQRDSVGYVFAFAGAVCIVCALLVAGSAVSLKPRQEANALLDRQKKVLTVAGLIREDQSVGAEEAATLFDENIRPVVVDLDTGAVQEGMDPADFDQRKAAKDPERSERAPPNPAKVLRVPDRALVYQVMERGQVRSIILPIEGKGLWSTLYGYIALGTDTNTIQGITFYEHGETPGLGGEVDNPRWKALWKGRKAFDERWRPVIAVKKGTAGPPAEDPHQVDGLSGATITSRGVGHLVRFWLGEEGFGPYLEEFRSRRTG